MLVTILVLFTLLTGGGVGTAAVRARRRKRRRLMRDAVLAPTPVTGGAEVSVFDIFWDLGVSDYALEIMGHEGYLIADVGDLRLVHQTIANDVETFGSYAAFVREHLETIQEFYNRHRLAGNRRDVPALTVKPKKTLPLPAVDASDSSDLPVVWEGEHFPVVARDFDDRVKARLRQGPGLMPLEQPASEFEVDVDEVTRIDPMRLLGGLFSGNLSQELSRWWEMRTLRGMRAELDSQLTRLFRHFQQEAMRDPRLFEHLYDPSRRWDLEARRIDDLLDDAPWKRRDWALCAEVLVRHAAAIARQLAWMSEQNVAQTIENIRNHARSGDTAMAGYLVYLNRHALFAGKGDAHAEHVRRIDAATYRMQQELRELMSRGVI